MLRPPKHAHENNDTQRKGWQTMVTFIFFSIKVLSIIFFVSFSFKVLFFFLFIVFIVAFFAPLYTKSKEKRRRSKDTVWPQSRFAPSLLHFREGPCPQLNPFRRPSSLSRLSLAFVLPSARRGAKLSRRLENTRYPHALFPGLKSPPCPSLAITFRCFSASFFAATRCPATRHALRCLSLLLSLLLLS